MDSIAITNEMNGMINHFSARKRNYGISLFLRKESFFAHMPLLNGSVLAGNYMLSVAVVFHLEIKTTGKQL